MCLIGLTIDIYLRMKRQTLILASIEGESCPYILRPEDLILLKRIINAGQITLWQYSKA